MKTQTTKVDNETIGQVSPAILREAADLAEQISTLTEQRNALDQQHTLLVERYNTVMANGIFKCVNLAPAKDKRRFSPEARANIAAGQREAWARRKAAENATAMPFTAAATEQSMSPAFSV